MADDITQQAATRAKRFLSPQEFSGLSGLSLATVHRYLKRGKLPFRQPGGPRGRILIPADALLLSDVTPQVPRPTEAAAESTPLPTSPVPLSGPRPRWMHQAGPAENKET
jgi:hypothetical protein